MNPRHALLAICLLSSGLTGNAWAQGFPPPQADLIMEKTPSPFPADWQSTVSLGTLLVYNFSGQPLTGLVQAFITSSEGNGVTGPRFQYFRPGVTTLPTPLITEWASISFLGEAKESLEKTGHLPDGSYQVMIRIFNIRTPSGQPLPDTFAFGTFIVSFPQPPSLLYPPHESVVVNPNPVFQWTPTFRASGTQPAYLLRIVEMLPGQTPLQSIEANYPLFEDWIEDATALPYPAEVPAFVDGRRYAWRVQAIMSPRALGRAQQGQIVPVGVNEGKSPVYTFTWRARIRAGATDAGVLGGVPAPDSPDRASPGRPGPGQRGLAPSPGFGGLRNFAEKLVHALVGRWNPRASQAAYRAEHAGARSATRADLHRALGDVVLAAAQDTTFGPFLPLPADTTSTVGPTAPPVPESAPTPVGEEGFGPQWLKLHGIASLTGETYSRNGVGTPTRPFQSARVTTGLAFGLMNDRLRMPLDALLSGDQVAFRQNINQVALSPRFSWAGLQAGNFSPQYSTFTLADATLLGGGIELTPQRWRIGFANGRSRKAIAADPTHAVQPQFARNVIAGRVGFGDPLTNTYEISVLRAKDDENSLGDPDTTIKASAESNTVYGFKVQHVLPQRHLRAQLEGAWSFYDRDQRADAPDVKGRAVGLKLFRETVVSSVGLSFEVLEGGFMSLGNSGISNDRVDIGFTGRTQLMSGKLSLNGNIGWRNDNVSKTLLAETARRNYSLNATWQPRPTLGADFQFGFLTSDVGGSDSVASSGNISRVLAVSPRVSWITRGIQQSLTGSATIQSSDNTTSAPVPLTSTSGVTFIANWSAAITPVFAVNFGGNYSRNDLEATVNEISAFGPGFSWGLPRLKLTSSAQLQFTRSRTGNFGTDTEFAPRCDLKWQTTPHHALILRGNFRRYHYAVGTSEFYERMASLEYAATL